MPHDRVPAITHIPPTVSNDSMRIPTDPGAVSGLCPTEHFPLTNGVTYLNSAGMGLVPTPVRDRAQAFLTSLALEGTRAYFAEVEEIQLAPRVAAAQLLAAELSSVAIVNNVAEGMSQFAWSVRPQSGQNVVLLDIDHPSATYPWIRVAEDTGAEIRFVQARTNPAALGFDQIAALVDRSTAVISLSHILWTTGFKFDLKDLAELAHAHGALLAVDATHSAGVVPIDVRQEPVDFLVATSFKWLCGFSGAAIFYIRPDLAAAIRPLLVGSKSAESEQQLRPADFDARHIALPPGAARFEYGSSSHISRLALAGSIDYLRRVGIGRINAHVKRLGTQLIDGLLDLGAEVLTPQDPTQRGGIITARFPGRDAVALSETLDARNLMVLPRLGGIRFSPHLFNDAEDIERALALLRRELRG